MERTAVRRRLAWQAATVTSVTRETASVVTITLDPPDWPGHRAGQHLDVRLTAEDGYTAERSYSIATAPGEPLAITVERLEGGEVSPYLTEEHCGDRHRQRRKRLPATCPHFVPSACLRKPQHRSGQSRDRAAARRRRLARLPHPRGQFRPRYLAGRAADTRHPSCRPIRRDRGGVQPTRQTAGQRHLRGAPWS